jgi:soluble lytic murein transglycosylase-like protein
MTFRLSLIILLASMLSYCIYTNDWYKYKAQYPRMSFEIYRVANLESYLKGLDKAVVLAIIDHESAQTWRPNITNGYDDGLMQINRVHGIYNVFDIRVNIAYGCKYLKHCIDKKRGNLYIGIMAYNQGCNRKEYNNYGYLMAILNRMR